MKSNEQVIEELHNEMESLNNKINHLSAFLQSNDANKISENQRRLMKDQLNAMHSYSDILKERYADLHIDGLLRYAKPAFKD